MIKTGSIQMPADVECNNFDEEALGLGVRVSCLSCMFCVCWPKNTRLQTTTNMC